MSDNPGDVGVSGLECICLKSVVVLEVDTLVASVASGDAVLLGLS